MTLPDPHLPDLNDLIMKDDAAGLREALPIYLSLVEIDYEDGKDEQTLLSFAAGQSTGDVCQVILDKGANPNHQNAEGQSPLYSAALIANVKPLSVLLNAGANVNVRENDGSTLFHTLANHPRSSEAITFMKVLMENHFSLINATDENGQTALQIAILEMKIETARYLVSKGARSDIPNNSGKTPLDYVFNYGGDWTRLFNRRPESSV